MEDLLAQMADQVAIWTVDDLFDLENCAYILAGYYQLNTGGKYDALINDIQNSIMANCLHLTPL